MIAEGTPESLGRGGPRAGARELPRARAASSPDELPLPDDATVEWRGRAVSFHTPTPTGDLAPLLSWAAVRGIELEGLTVSPPTLEDVYLQLTQETA